MRLLKGITLRKMLGEWIAVPGGESALTVSGLLSMNETGAYLFHLLQSEQSEESLLQALLQEYDVSEEQGLKDVRSFLDYLRRNELLVEETA